MPPFPSFTKTWHSASYEAISPTRPELTTADKVVVITGGGTGIGAGIARAFATSGSMKIALIGRRKEPLLETAKALEADFPGLVVFPCSADITNKGQVDAAFSSTAEKFGPIDILISNAGYLSAGTVREMNPDSSWAAFEVHAKGSILVAQAFDRTKNQKSSFVVDTSSIVIAMPPWPASAAYTASKMAATKIWDFYRVENPSTRVISMQPGQVPTEMAKKIYAGFKDLDHVDLPSHFAVWLVGPEAGFLNGTFVCANWDVEELMARKDEYEKTDLGTIKLEGFPAFKAMAA